MVMDTKRLRLFLGVRPDPETLKTLITAQQAMRQLKGFSRVRWVPPENIHLTLHFLGHLEERLAWDLRDKLVREVGAHVCHAQKMDHLIFFPSARWTRVVGVGGRPASAEYLALVQHLAAVLTELGIGVEKRKPYPHLTLGRMGSPQDMSAVSMEILSTELKVESVCLFQSQLQRGGALYSVVADYPLAPRDKAC